MLFLCFKSKRQTHYSSKTSIFSARLVSWLVLASLLGAVPSSTAQTVASAPRNQSESKGSPAGSPWKNYTIDDGLANAFVTCLAEDTLGTLWAGTWSGLSNLRKGTSKWESLGEADGLPGSRMSCLAAGPDGSVWAGALPLSSKGGLARVSGGKVAEVTEAHGLTSDKITALAIEPDGKVWIGTWGAGVMVFDPVKWRVEQAFTENEGLSSNDVVAIEVIDGKVWVCTKYNGVSVREGSAWTVYNEHTSGLRNNSVHSMAVTSSDYWFGTWAGAFRVQRGRDLKNHENWTEYTDFMNRLADRFVRVIAAAPDGRVFFGTDRGLSGFDGVAWTTWTTTTRRETLRDSATGKWKPSVHPEVCLLSNTVLDILIDSRGVLWVATDRGVSSSNLESIMPIPSTPAPSSQTSTAPTEITPQVSAGSEKGDGK